MVEAHRIRSRSSVQRETQSSAFDALQGQIQPSVGLQCSVFYIPVFQEVELFRLCFR